MTYRVTSEYGAQESFRSEPHNGIDFSMESGTPLRSIKEGIVKNVTNYEGNIGKGVMVQWDNGQISIYGHMSKVTVEEGEHVSTGELLGYSGNTGNSTGAHLHFGLKEDGHFVNPSSYIDEIQNMNDGSYLAHNSNMGSSFDFGELMKQQTEIFNDLMKSIDVNTIIFYFNKVFMVIIDIMDGFI